MLTLLCGAECYSPDYLGTTDLLIGGDQILAMGPELDIQMGGKALQRVDARDYLIIPGLVDSLVHIIGGGGEGGFGSRTPEMPVTAAYQAGITTMVGALGTDSVTRTLSNLLAKSRELQLSGIQCYCHTGSYHVPVKTLTGSVERDIIYIPEFIGVGEVAISDHRSSQPSTQSLAALAAEARVAGMIAGKAGIVSVHVGDGSECLEPLWQVSRDTEIPLQQFYPTHINRNPELFAAGIAFAKAGGTIDLTTSTTPELLSDGEVACGAALPRLLQAKVPLERVTFSSDGHASLPRYDAEGHLAGMQVGDPGSLWQALRSAVLEHGISLEQVLPVATRNPAQLLKLQGAGELAAGHRADLVMVEKESLKIHSVMSAGQWRLRDARVVVEAP